MRALNVTLLAPPCGAAKRLQQPSIVHHGLPIVPGISHVMITEPGQRHVVLTLSAHRCHVTRFCACISVYTRRVAGFAWGCALFMRMSATLCEWMEGNDDPTQSLEHRALPPAWCSGRQAGIPSPAAPLASSAEGGGGFSTSPPSVPAAVRVHTPRHWQKHPT